MVELGVPGIVRAVEIGRGGFGTVYRGVEEDLGREVAVKLLPAGLAQRDHDRFDRERRAMGSLSGHPNIVTVHRTGFTDDGRPYIVMEYLEQGSMDDRLRRGGPLPWTEAARVGIALAGAVEAAHRAGILHRDIKPGNVLLDPWDQPKLADFGIARLEGAPETSSSVVTASVAHAGPEIIDGTRPSEASDLYSLASTVYTLIAGRAPFDHPDDQSIVPLLARIARQPVPPLPGAPEPLFAALERAMAKVPSDRQPSAEAFGRQLAAVVGDPTGTVGGPVVAGPGTGPDAGPGGETAVVEPPGWREPAGASVPVAADRPGPADPHPVADPDAAPGTDRGRRRWPLVAVAGVVLAGLAGVGAAALLGGADEPAAALPEVTGADYDGYVTTFDASGAIRVALPEAWDDTDLGGSAVLATIGAAADLDAALATADEPGVIITANPDAATDPDAVLDDLVDPSGCRDRGRGAYDDGVLRGRFHHLDDCGSTGAQVWVVAATPADDRFTLVLSAQAIDPRDETAARRVLDSLAVDARAVPGS